MCSSLFPMSKGGESLRRLCCFLLCVAIIPVCSSQRSQPHTMQMAHANGETMEMPKGIFHYSNAENTFESKMKLPEMNPINPLAALSDLIDTAAEAGSKRQSMSAIHIPMPFGMRPFNVQLSQDSERGVGMSNSMADDEKRNETAVATRIDTEAMPQMTKEQREALEKARTVCLQKSQKECDTALEEYHRIRFHKSPMTDEALARKTGPQDVGGFIEQGLAKWIVPGLEAKLKEMASSRSSSHEESHEGAENPSVDQPRNPFGEIRRHPGRRRARLRLPARGSAAHTNLPPRSLRRTSKLSSVPR